jgi:hypothetical protein
MRNVILWNHERGTWQYDVFCLLIIAFIFLTPKAWFKGKERDTTPRMLSVVQAEDFLARENKLVRQNIKSDKFKDTDISK